jgi:hypothetical protein
MSFGGAWGFMRARAGNGHSLAVRAVHPADKLVSRLNMAKDDQWRE